MLFSEYLPIIAGLLFSVGVIFLIFLTVRILRNAHQTERERRYQASAWRSELRRLIAVVAGIAMIGLANLTFWVNSELKLYGQSSPGFPLGAVSMSLRVRSATCGIRGILRVFCVFVANTRHIMPRSFSSTSSAVMRASSENGRSPV